MSWFYSAPVAKIYPRNKYYFLTSERSAAGYFKLYTPEIVTVTTDLIKRPPESGIIQAIPREYINKLNPQRDFVIKTKILFGESTVIFSEFSMAEVLTKHTIGNPEYLTHAILSAGEPSLDFEDRILIIPNGLFVPKFTDSEVLNKMLSAMHEAISRTNWAEFTMESEDNSLTVKVSLSLSSEAKLRFTSKEVGRFRLK